MHPKGVPARRLAWPGLAVALGLLGAALDQIHVQSGLLSYPHPAWWDQAWWVPLNFAVLLTSLVAVTIPLARAGAPLLGGSAPPANATLAVDFAWFAGAYALSGLVAPDHPGLLAAAYVVVWVVRIGLRRDRTFLVPYGIALALAGCGVEAAEIALGWFSYAEPDVAGVPLWLAGIYLHGAPLALGVARRLDEAMPGLERPERSRDAHA